jgi:hypothetical protein
MFDSILAKLKSAARVAIRSLGAILNRAPFWAAPAALLALFFVA